MDKEGKSTHFGEKLIPEAEKKARVGEVFTSVAKNYDLMNDLMSFGTHRLWKRHVASKTKLSPGERALDVAGGTADIALLLRERVGSKGKVVLYDINHEMLELGREKCIDAGAIKEMEYVRGDAESIPFETNSFDCVTIGFGIRNVTHIDTALSEMTRVARPGARVVCLEFSHPKSALFSKLYDMYSFSVIPRIGEAVTGNRGAYTYLPESIRKFPVQEEFKRMMENAGLYQVNYHNLFCGIAAVHIGTKV